MSTDGLKVGDKIVDNGRIFRIFKIGIREALGEKNKIVYFKPYFANGSNTSTIVSIPLKSLKSSDIRKPVDKSKIREVRNLLAIKNSNSKIDTDILKEKISENEIEQTALVAKYLWQEKNDEDKSFSLTKRRLLDEAIRSLSEEFAFVLGKNLDSAEKSIKRALSS